MGSASRLRAALVVAQLVVLTTASPAPPPGGSYYSGFQEKVRTEVHISLGAGMTVGQSPLLS